MSAVITTYLQDHHAGSAAGVDLFERVAKNHGDPEVRARVGRMVDEIAADQDELEQIMSTVDVKPSLVKDLPGKVGEKIARLKPNEKIVGRSPLSDVLELEMLVIAVHGKSLGWRLLAQVEDPRLNREQLHRLYNRAVAQLDELEELRLSQAPKLLHE